MQAASGDWPLTSCDAAIRGALSSIERRESGEELGIVREFPCVLECQSGGAIRLAADGECGDLDDLALAASGGACLLLRLGDVSLCGAGVAVVSCQHGKEGMFDGAHLGVHPDTIHEPAVPGLTRH